LDPKGFRLTLRLLPLRHGNAISLRQRSCGCCSLLCSRCLASKGFNLPPCLSCLFLEEKKFMVLAILR
jgi:hypothetical protein